MANRPLPLFRARMVRIQHDIPRLQPILVGQRAFYWKPRPKFPTSYGGLLLLVVFYPMLLADIHFLSSALYLLQTRTGAVLHSLWSHILRLHVLDLLYLLCERVYGWNPLL